MKYLSAINARSLLYKLIDEVSNTHEPTIIKGKRNHAVLLSLEDWEDIQETLFVVQNKELSESILEGMKTSYEECSKKLDW